MTLPDYPDDADGDALRRVAADGSDMNHPMVVDFAVAVPSEASAQAVAGLAARHGYEPSVGYDEEHDAWSVYCSRSMVPRYDAIMAAQAELDALGRLHGGHGDGWGTFGNAPERQPP